ncbi:MAG: hypothetical protein KAV87_56680, partial [Desulfobacteraceae bacterium]|nr:hypothetical protein [Desulfobacteraceae bacterium]
KAYTGIDRIKLAAFIGRDLNFMSSYKPHSGAMNSTILDTGLWILDKTMVFSLLSSIWHPRLPYGGQAVTSIVEPRRFEAELRLQF